jgi:hypothetical protein
VGRPGQNLPHRTCNTSSHMRQSAISFHPSRSAVELSRFRAGVSMRGTRRASPASGTLRSGRSDVDRVPYTLYFHKSEPSPMPKRSQSCRRKRLRRKIPVATLMMTGPVGRWTRCATRVPSTVSSTATTTAQTSIPVSERARRFAVAAGMMTRDPMSNTPR